MPDLIRRKRRKKKPSPTPTTREERDKAAFPIQGRSLPDLPHRGEGKEKQKEKAKKEKQKQKEKEKNHPPEMAGGFMRDRPYMVDAY